MLFVIVSSATHQKYAFQLLSGPVTIFMLYFLQIFFMADLLYAHFRREYDMSNPKKADDTNGKKSSDDVVLS